MHRFLIPLAIAACTAVPATAVSQSTDTQPVHVFKQNCAACHAEDGGGSPLGKRLNVPDLRSKEVQGHPKAELVEAVTKGKGKMPAFGSQLTAEQIDGVIDYVRSLHSTDTK